MYLHLANTVERYQHHLYQNHPHNSSRRIGAICYLLFAFVFPTPTGTLEPPARMAPAPTSTLAKKHKSMTTNGAGPKAIKNRAFRIKDDDQEARYTFDRHHHNHTFVLLQRQSNSFSKKKKKKKEEESLGTCTRRGGGGSLSCVMFCTTIVRTVVLGPTAVHRTNGNKRQRTPSR